MKYWYRDLGILVPWFDTDGNKQWSNVKFTGWVHRRVLRRCLRKFIKANFGLQARKSYLDALITMSCLRPSDATYVRKRATDAEVEEWIGRIQCNDDDNETDDEAITSIQNEPSGEARLALPVVQDQPEVRRTEEPVC